MELSLKSQQIQKIKIISCIITDHNGIKQEINSKECRPTQWSIYSTIKKNGMMVFVGKWIELEIIRLSEVNHIQKDKDCMLFLIYGI
jgi:hypothetical protein